MAYGVEFTYSRFINWNWDMFCFRLCSYSADKKSRDLAPTFSALTCYTTCFFWLMTGHLEISEISTLKETILEKKNRKIRLTALLECVTHDFNSHTLDLCVCISLPFEITIKITYICFKTVCKIVEVQSCTFFLFYHLVTSIHDPISDRVSANALWGFFNHITKPSNWWRLLAWLCYLSVKQVAVF